MDYFNSQPLEIQLDILSRVPAESLLNDTQLVCKTRNDLVHHPSMPRLHLHHINHDDYGKLCFLASTGSNNMQKFKYFEYNHHHESATPIERIRRVHLKTPIYLTYIVGSCNGLICLGGHPSLFVCNPITREQVMLPQIQFSDTDKYSKWTSGFGYVPSTDEYKIVGLLEYSSPLPKTAEVHIYTIGGGTGWRNLGKFNIDVGLDLQVRGAFANETLYWIGRNSKMIVNFDLAEEKFCQHLSTPPLPPDGYPTLNMIGVLDGSLYFAVWIKKGYSYDIWLLENKNAIKKREDHPSSGCIWTKKFKLRDTRLVAVTKSGGILTHYCGYYLNIYDPKIRISKRLVDFKEIIREKFPHQNTLVSLKQLGEEGTQIMESIEIEKMESCDSLLEHPEEVEVLDFKGDNDGVNGGDIKQVVLPFCCVLYSSYMVPDENGFRIISLAALLVVRFINSILPSKENMTSVIRMLIIITDSLCSISLVGVYIFILCFDLLVKV